jgi:hypothetical protein
VLLIIHSVETSNPTFYLCLPDMYMHEFLLSCPVIVFFCSTVYVYTNLSFLVNFFFMKFIRMYFYLESKTLPTVSGNSKVLGKCTVNHEQKYINTFYNYSFLFIASHLRFEWN